MEVFQKISETVLKKCPDCQKDTLQKLISAAGFQLKGTGWYATDFRDKGKAPEKKSESTESGGGDKTTSDSKKVDSNSTGKEN